MISKSRTPFEKVADPSGEPTYTASEMVATARPTNYRLKSEVSITLHCQLCSTRYAAFRIKNCLKSTSAIKIATMTNTDDFRYEGKSSHAIAKSTLALSAKMNGTQRRTLVSP